MTNKYRLEDMLFGSLEKEQLLFTIISENNSFSYEYTPEHGEAKLISKGMATYSANGEGYLFTNGMHTYRRSKNFQDKLLLADSVFFITENKKKPFVAYSILPLLEDSNLAIKNIESGEKTELGNDSFLITQHKTPCSWSPNGEVLFYTYIDESAPDKGLIQLKYFNTVTGENKTLKEINDSDRHFEIFGCSNTGVWYEHEDSEHKNNISLTNLNKQSLSLKLPKLFALKYDNQKDRIIVKEGNKINTYTGTDFMLIKSIELQNNDLFDDYAINSKDFIAQLNAKTLELNLYKDNGELYHQNKLVLKEISPNPVGRITPYIQWREK